MSHGRRTKVLEFVRTKWERVSLFFSIRIRVLRNRLKQKRVWRQLLVLVFGVGMMGGLLQLNGGLGNSQKYFLAGFTTFSLIIIFIPGLLRGAVDLVGVGYFKPSESKWWSAAEAVVKYLSVSVVAILFIVYILSGVANIPTPGVPQLGVGVSGLSFGGLMTAIANNRRINDYVHERVMRVAQKLIVSALLLGLFALLFMGLESLGTVDPNVLELGTIGGWLRGAFFWGSALSLVVAGMLFSVGIVEMVFVLRLVTRSRLEDR